MLSKFCLHTQQNGRAVELGLRVDGDFEPLRDESCEDKVHMCNKMFALFVT